MKMSVADWQRLLIRIRKNDPTLSELDLSRQEINDTNMQALTETLTSNSTMLSLKLNDNQISSIGLKMLVNVWKSHPTFPLRNLNICSNQIDEVETLAELLKTNRSLMVLDLGSNRITDRTVQPLIDAVKVNHTLTTFNLDNYGLFIFSGNNISGARLKQINELITRNQFLKGQLYQAIKKGDLQRIDSLLQQGVNILSVIDQGEHKDNLPLHWAVIHNKVDIARHLIQVMRSLSLPLTLLNAKGQTASQLAKQPDMTRLFTETTPSTIETQVVMPLPSAPPVDSLSTPSTTKVVMKSETLVIPSVPSASAPTMQSLTVATSFSHDELQKYFEDISIGNHEARKKLNDYFDNKSGSTANSILDVHKKLAFDYFSRAVERNQNRHEQSFLGKCYFSSYGVPQDYELAFKWYLKAAEQHDSIAQTFIGIMYEQGKGVKQNYEEAFKWYHQAAEQNYPVAQYNLSLMYDKGLGGKQDHDGAVKLLYKAAEQNNVQAQVRLGSMYEKGQGIGQDFSMGVKWYRRAAEQSNVTAQFNLALMYEKGQGVQQDYAEARLWFLKAAEQNHAKAQYNLGMLYEYGHSVEKDSFEALKWYRKAAEQKYAPAQVKMGYMYEQGYGVDKNYTDAMKWYRLAADQNNVAAYVKLGHMYEYGLGIKQDYSEALKWFSKAAEQNNSHGQYRLASMYYLGKGVEEDNAVALKWFLKAAENNHVYAQYLAGLIYKSASLTGVQQDLRSAFKWIKNAAEKNHVKAQYNLGLIYYKGEGTKPNYAEAYKWLHKAAEQNDVAAQSLLGINYYHGKNVKKNPAEALKWLHLAAEQNDVESQCCLGKIYTQGVDVKQDYLEAFKWLHKAAEQNHVDAQALIGMIYYSGKNGINKDYSEALKWLHKAADQNNSGAQLTLGLMYMNGNGMVKNIPEAIYWLLLASDQKETDASTLLAGLDKQGHGKIIAEQQQFILTAKRRKQIADEENKQKEELGLLERKEIEAQSNQSTELKEMDESSAVVSTPSVIQSSHPGNLQVSFVIEPTDLEIKHLLGVGAYGQVHFGLWHEHTQVAIKELKATVQSDTAKSEFLNEAQVMANLHSPRIVRLYGVCFGTTFRLVMEYLPNGSLYDVLQHQESISWSQRIRIALDMGEGLHFLHVQKPMILHRDLKSLNVLLDANFGAKLTDFGLAQVKHEINFSSNKLNNQHKSVGTLAWMAPELFTAKPEYSSASDVFAYGIVLWEMASGTIPYRNADINLIPIWVAQGHRENIPPETPIKYAALIKRCWDGRREQRPTVNEVLTELKAMEVNTQKSDSSATNSSTSASSSTNSGPCYDSENASIVDSPQYDAGLMSQQRK